MDLFLYSDTKTKEVYLYVLANDGVYLTALKLRDRNQKLISTLDKIHVIQNCYDINPINGFLLVSIACA